jgi:hypothetical protein
LLVHSGGDTRSRERLVGIAAALAALVCLALAPAALADPPQLGTLSFAPNPIAANHSTTGTVSLSAPASGGDVTVALGLNPSSAASVPATVTIPEGQTSAQFPATDLGSASSWTVTATLGASQAADTVFIQAPAAHAVINEIDYDQPGTDTGEFVEIFNPTASTLDLHHLALALVNGATNAEYSRTSLASAHCLPPGGYVVVADPGLTVPVSSGVVRFPAASSNILNPGASGAGVALVDTSGPTLIDSLSYGGSVTAANLTGFATTQNLVEGTATGAVDSNTVVRSLDREPNGKDTDDAQSDWTQDGSPTPGAGNGGVGPAGSVCPDQAPVLDPIGAKSVAVGQTLSFTVSGSDPDAEDVLTYSADGLPDGATFDPATRGFSWTPTTAEAGTYPGVQFHLSDGIDTDSETITITVTAPPPAPPVVTLQNPPAPPVLTPALPTTKLGKLRLNRKKRGVTFRFSSSEKGSTFVCKLDKKRFAACRSPKTYTHLKPGRHTFQVKAKDGAGVDPTPAVRKFTVKRGR